MLRTKQMNKYYTYAFLREDGTPYYVGKGSGHRCYKNTGRAIKGPKDKSRIIKLKQNLTEEQAFTHEVYMIAILPNLRNICPGGFQPPSPKGRKHSEETKRKIRESNKKTKSKGVSEETRKKMSVSAKKRAQSKKGKEALRSNGFKTSSLYVRDEKGMFTDRKIH